jgi:hypothetical protein
MRNVNVTSPVPCSMTQFAARMAGHTATHVAYVVLPVHSRIRNLRLLAMDHVSNIN